MMPTSEALLPTAVIRSRVFGIGGAEVAAREQHVAKPALQGGLDRASEPACPPGIRGCGRCRRVAADADMRLFATRVNEHRLARISYLASGRSTD